MKTVSDMPNDMTLAAPQVCLSHVKDTTLTDNADAGKDTSRTNKDVALV